MQPHARNRRRVLARLAAFALATTLFTVAARMLAKEFAGHDVQEFLDATAALPAWRLGCAVLSTAVGYFVLTAYDVLALRHLRIELSYRQTAAASFVAYVGSHNVGLGGLGGAALRWRTYGAWGLSPLASMQISLFAGLTYWLGWAALAPFAFARWGSELARDWGLASWTFHALGVAQIAFVVWWLAWCRGGERTWKLAGQLVRRPERRTAELQVLLSATDWALVASTAFVLLPAHAPMPWDRWLAIFLGAQLAGWLSHVPAGLGVLELVVIHATRDSVSLSEVTAALLLFRLIYFLLPLGAGAIVYANLELNRRRERRAARVVRDCG